ncbi:hypothetical protein ACO0R3_000711 [Hanseniaspora guilliermondii]
MENNNREELIKQIKDYEAENERLVSNITRLQIGNKRLRLEYAVLLEQLERTAELQERHSIEELPTLKNLTKDLNIATKNILRYVVDNVSKSNEQKKQEFIDSFIEKHVNLSKGIEDQVKKSDIKKSLKEAILEAALIHNKMKGTMIRTRGPRKKKVEKEETSKEEQPLKKLKVKGNDLVKNDDENEENDSQLEDQDSFNKPKEFPNDTNIDENNEQEEEEIEDEGNNKSEEVQINEKPLEFVIENKTSSNMNVSST